MRAVQKQVARGVDALFARQDRVDALDGVRALAVTMVVLCHTYVLPGGYIGVDVFFALSGYLITGLLLGERRRTGEIGLRGFYWRRTVRLLPALLVLAIAGLAYDALRRHSLHTVSFEALPSVLLYVGNWRQVARGPDALGLFGHTWSLAVEEQFYLVWPALLLLAARWRGGAAGLAIAAIAASSVWCVWLLGHGAPDVRFRGSDTEVAPLMIGCLLAVAPAGFGRLARRVWPTALAVILFAAAQGRLSAGSTLVVEALVASATAVLIAAVAAAPQGGLSRTLAWPPLVALGRISYGLYLWHLPVTLALNGHLHDPFVLAAAVATISILLALTSWIFVELPAQSLRRFRLPRLSESQAA